MSTPSIWPPICSSGISSRAIPVSRLDQSRCSSRTIAPASSPVVTTPTRLSMLFFFRVVVSSFLSTLWNTVISTTLMTGTATRKYRELSSGALVNSRPAELMRVRIRLNLTEIFNSRFHGRVVMFSLWSKVRNVSR